MAVNSYKPFGRDGIVDLVSRSGVCLDRPSMGEWRVRVQAPFFSKLDGSVPHSDLCLLCIIVDLLRQ